MKRSLLPSLRSSSSSALGLTRAPRAARSRASRVRASEGRNDDDAINVAGTNNNNDQRSASSSASTSTSTGKPEEKEEDLGLGLKSVWYAAEALGNVIGATKGGGGESDAGTNNNAKQGGSGSPSTSSTSFSASSPLPRALALEMLRADYDVDYFISGKGEMRAYAEYCEFRDPFAGFKGTARFKNNVSNLGSSLEEARTDLLSWEEGTEGGGGFLKTTWRFSGIVGLLPWRPRLAAAGSTTHVFDPETGLVVQHIEAWASSPSEVVRSLLRPANKLLPANRWEVAAACLYEGDLKGLWFASAGGVAKVAGALAAGSSAVKLLLSSGGEFEGGPGAAELALLLLALSAAVTVVLETLGIGDGNVGKRR